MKDLTSYEFVNDSPTELGPCSLEPQNLKDWAIDMKSQLLIHDFHYIFEAHPFTVICFSIGKNQLQISRMDSNCLSGARYSFKGYYRDGNEVEGKSKNHVVYTDSECHNIIRNFVKISFEKRSEVKEFLNWAEQSCIRPQSLNHPIKRLS